jgi:cell division transport system permease protein
MNRDNGRDTGARGAHLSRTGFSDLWQAWWRHHLDSALDGFGRLADAPLQTLMTSLVVAIALVLPAVLLLALANVQRLGERWDADPKLTAYLHLQAQPAAIEVLRERLQTLPEVVRLDYVSQEQALREFQAQSGFGEALAGLDHNPLPPTLVITPSSTSPEALDKLRAKVAAEAIVQEVALDMAWVRRLHAYMEFGRQLVLGLAGLLALGVLLVIGNTIRLEIESRRDEIVVTKLVGATNGFVRRPFLYTGAWYGVIGGLLACLLISTGAALLDKSVRQLAASYQSDFQLQGLGLAGCGLLMLGCVGLGLVGAWLAVGRHLSAIEPR